MNKIKIIQNSVLTLCTIGIFSASMRLMIHIFSNEVFNLATFLVAVVIGLFQLGLYYFVGYIILQEWKVALKK